MTYQLSKKDFYAEPLSKHKAIPDEFVKEAYLVFACRHKFCRDICPNFDITRNEAHTSYGFHTSILAISRGVGEFDKLMDNFTHCLECGACELRCPNTSMGGDFYLRSTTTVDLVRKVRRDHLADGGEIKNWQAVKDYLDEHRGFVATQDEEKFTAEFPSLLFGVTPTIVEGEYGFGEVFFERTSYASREKAKDFLGTMAQLHGIGAGVYLALMGPQGMVELGEGIMQRAAYLAGELNKLDGVTAPKFSAPFFKEFVVDFGGTGKKVADINKQLLERKIFGGKDLSEMCPDLGQSALYCVTEVHTRGDLDALVTALKEIL